jgi:antitoxin component YwqK of YwqJK toxin-antitoxin module
MNLNCFTGIKTLGFFLTTFYSIFINAQTLVKKNEVSKFQGMKIKSDSIILDTVKYYYNNGQLKYQGTALSNSNHGKYQSFFKNGKIHEQGNYQYGYLDGERIFYDKKSRLVEISNYLFGKLNGKYEYYNSEGKLIEHLNYRNDELDDTCRWYHFNNQGLRYEVLFKNTVPWTVLKSFDSKGQYLSENNLKQGNGNFYYEEFGSTRLYQLISNDTITTEKIFTKSGKLVTLKTYSIRIVQSDSINGQIRNSTVLIASGKYNEYYLNKQVKVQGSYNQGKQNGRWIYYKRNGKITSYHTFD